MINLEKEIREQPGTLSKIKENCLDIVKKVADEAKKREVRYVYLSARGTSDHACIYAQYLIQTYIGLPCMLGTPSVLTKYDGKLCLKDALVIGVSQSGAAEDVLAVLKRAKECGAMSVGITNTPGSLVAENADYHIYLGVGYEQSIAATKTFTAQLAVMALLCACWNNNETLLADFDRLPGLIQEILDTVPEKIASFVNDFKDFDNGVVLGRGFNYPIALEGALKIMETNKISMRGYPTSDFYHGPFAQLTNKGTAFLIAPEGVMLDDAKAVLAKLRTTPATVVCISDNEGILSDCKYSIKIPAIGNEALSPFLFVIAFQLFALKLCEVKGIDPDKSNVIKKVTVTK